MTIPHNLKVTIIDNSNKDFKYWCEFGTINYIHQMKLFAIDYEKYRIELNSFFPKLVEISILKQKEYFNVFILKDWQ